MLVSIVGLIDSEGRAVRTDGDGVERNEGVNDGVAEGPEVGIDDGSEVGYNDGI